jgi:hypothetical protein
MQVAIDPIEVFRREPELGCGWHPLVRPAGGDERLECLCASDRAASLEGGQEVGSERRTPRLLAMATIAQQPVLLPSYIGIVIEDVPTDRLWA